MEVNTYDVWKCAQISKCLKILLVLVIIVVKIQIPLNTTQVLFELQQTNFLFHYVHLLGVQVWNANFSLKNTLNSEER